MSESTDRCERSVALLHALDHVPVRILYERNPAIDLLYRRRAHRNAVDRVARDPRPSSESYPNWSVAFAPPYAVPIPSPPVINGFSVRQNLST